MKTLTAVESAEWCQTVGVPLESDGKLIRSDGQSQGLRFEIPKAPNQLTWFCHFIEASLQPRDRCLMFVAGWGIWPSSENWHLYYRLRQSYGDYRLLDDAPGHLFLNYEGQDLVSLLQVGIIGGWDIHLVPSRGYGRAFVSHDEWLELVMADPAELKKIDVDLTKAGVKKI